MKNKKSKRTVRTLSQGEEKKHFDMLNLAFDIWGNEEEWRKKYIQPGFDVKENVLVVEEGGKWAGGVTAWFREAFLKNGKEVKVYTVGDLYVLSGFRGKGISSTAMKGLNKLAKARGAVLAFSFPSIYRLTSLTLPKYGFVSVIYPKTRILMLNPEKFLSYIIEEVKEANLPAKFEGMSIKLIVRFDSALGRSSVSKTFKVEKGTLTESTETEKIDLKVTMNAALLLKFSSKFYLGKKALFPTLLLALVRRQFGVRFSFRFLRAFLRL